VLAYYDVYGDKQASLLRNIFAKILIGIYRQQRKKTCHDKHSSLFLSEKTAKKKNLKRLTPEGLC